MSELYALQEEVKALKANLTAANQLNAKLELGMSSVHSRMNIISSYFQSNVTNEDYWSSDRDQFLMSMDDLEVICRAAYVNLSRHVSIDVILRGQVTVSVPLWEDETKIFDHLYTDHDGTICVSTTDGRYEIETIYLDLEEA